MLFCCAVCVFVSCHVCVVCVLLCVGLFVWGSCSMHVTRDELVDLIRSASRHLDKTAQVVFIGGQGPDHPIHPAIPETSYLKCVIARVLGA